MTDATSVQQALEAAVAARQEMAGLTERLGTARSDLASAVRRVTECRTRLDAESEDVARLESFSPTRILASLRGSRASDLERETAERDAARYAVAEAEARRHVVQEECEALETRIRALGDVDAEHARALDAMEAWLSSQHTDVAARLADVAERRGRLVARDRETAEAHAAGVRAHQHLAAARQKLGSAESWSTWDAFGGGGMLTDMAKYQRMDEATAMLRHAELALQGFSRELGDVGLPAVAGVRVDGLARTFDVWFDSFFADLHVRSRIQQAAAGVDHTIQVVAQALQVLEARGRELADELRELDREREQLLVAGA